MYICTMERARRTLSELSFKSSSEPSLLLVSGGNLCSAKGFDELRPSWNRDMLGHVLQAKKNPPALPFCHVG